MRRRRLLLPLLLRPSPAAGFRLALPPPPQAPSRRGGRGRAGLPRSFRRARPLELDARPSDDPSGDRDDGSCASSVRALPVVASSSPIDPAAWTFRPVRPSDAPRCASIEAASYPPDEAASPEMLARRAEVAGDYFWVASVPRPADGDAGGDDGGDDDDDDDGGGEGDLVVGFVCGTRCREFAEESMSTHVPRGKILAIHSVVVDASHRRRGIARAMLRRYLAETTGRRGVERTMLLAKARWLGFYVDGGFAVVRPSPISHGRDAWYELEARREPSPSGGGGSDLPTTPPPRLVGSSRSTSDPDEGARRTSFAVGRDRRRAKLHAELAKVGIDPSKLESDPDEFGAAATRTYDSFLLPKSEGAFATAESPTRAKVAAANVAFLAREHRADRARWLRNVDRGRRGDGASDDEASDDEGGAGRARRGRRRRHPVSIVLDNVRSAHNVGNILRLAEAAGVESVWLCGTTPRPPHPKVMKTAVGAAERVPLGDEEASASTLEVVLRLKSDGHRVLGVETTEDASSIWDASLGADDDAAAGPPIAYVFGNELIGVDVRVLGECDDVVCLPTYGMKNSLNVATCAGIVVWETLRRLRLQRLDRPSQ